MNACLVPSSIGRVLGKNNQNSQAVIEEIDSLQYNELNTVLIEIETIVNAQPLTYIEDGEDGLNYSLTSSHLINGKKICTMFNSQHHENIGTHNILTKKYKSQRNFKKAFDIAHYYLEETVFVSIKGKSFPTRELFVMNLQLICQLAK